MCLSVESRAFFIVFMEVIMHIFIYTALTITTFWSVTVVLMFLGYFWYVYIDSDSVMVDFNHIPLSTDFSDLFGPQWLTFAFLGLYPVLFVLFCLAVIGSLLSTIGINYDTVKKMYKETCDELRKREGPLLDLKNDYERLP